MVTAAPTTRGKAVARFFETYLSHRKGERAGQPFHLDVSDWAGPWQRQFMDEFYEIGPNGRRVYRLGFLGVPRGNGKTPVSAGLGLFELLTRKDAPNVFNVAASRDQARILIDSAREMVEDSLKLMSWCEPSRSIIRSNQNHGVMRVLSSSGSLLHGLNPTAILFDELHAVMMQDQEEAYIAMMTSLHKRGAYMLNTTTAGYNKETLLGKAYDESLRLDDGEDLLGGCLRIRRDRKNGVLFYWYGIPEARASEWEDEELWRLVNPASWVHIEDLRQQLHSPGFHELDFKRLHLNMWTSARDSWLPAGLWSSLRSDMDIPDGGDVYVGIDVGQYHDTTAVSWAHRTEDPTSPTGWKVIVRSRVWGVIGDQPHDVFVQGGRMRMDLIGEFLEEELGKRYAIREVVYDPMLFASEADRLADRGMPMFELPQGGGAMIEAYQRFYAAAKEGTITHGGPNYPNGDPVLTAHIEAAAADMTERGWRVRKMKSTNVIDAAVSTTMAFWRADRQEAPSVYEKRGLFMLDVGSTEEDELDDDDVYADDDWDEDLEEGPPRSSYDSDDATDY